MLSALVVGCGDLGSEIARILYVARYKVTGIRFSNRPIANIQCIQADVTRPDSIKHIEKLKPNVIVYCVAAKERSDESYYQHYVLGLKNILDSQQENDMLEHFFFVSSTRVYGQEMDSALDECDVPLPSDFGGKRLLEAENMLKHTPYQTTSLRLSGIYGEGRTYLLNLSKNPNHWPEKNAFSNRIHRDDAAQFIAFLCKKSAKKELIDDCYIVTDDMPVPQYDVLMWLADQQNIDVAQVKVPKIKGGKRLSNGRLRHTGFQLQYPSYQTGYAALLEL